MSHRSTANETNETIIAIQKEFMHQYSEHDYNSLTIKAICTGIPIARTTFYSYYQNIGELKEEIEDNLLSGILNIVNQLSESTLNQHDFSLFFDMVLSYIQSNWDYFYIFLVAQPNSQFIKKWGNAIKLHFKRRFATKVNTPSYELVLEITVSAIMGAYTYWLRYPTKVDTKKLNQLVVSSLETMTKQM